MFDFLLLLGGWHRWLRWSQDGQADLEDHALEPVKLWHALHHLEQVDREQLADLLAFPVAEQELGLYRVARQRLAHCPWLTI